MRPFYRFDESSAGGQLQHVRETDLRPLGMLTVVHEDEKDCLRVLLRPAVQRCPGGQEFSLLPVLHAAEQDLPKVTAAA